MNTVQFGLCQCGCGMKTDISPKSNRYWGYVKGQPFRFIRGHQGRKTPIDFVIEDRGYATPCWVWQRSTDTSGYASKRFGGRLRSVYKYLWEKINGLLPAGHQPDHLCRVRACIRPDHIEVIPRAENVQRGSSAKLDAKAVQSIRSLRASGETHSQIAKRFGVTKNTIGFVCRGITWANVPREVA